MVRPNPPFKSFSRCLLDSLNSLRSHGELFDVILQCGNTLFKAHRVLLAAYSPLFKNYLTEFVGSYSSAKLTIKLPVDNVNHVRMILDFLYSGSLEQMLEIDELKALSCTAGKLQVWLLVNYLEEQISAAEGASERTSAKKRKLVLDKTEIICEKPIVAETYFREIEPSTKSIASKQTSLGSEIVKMNVKQEAVSGLFDNEVNSSQAVENIYAGPERTNRRVDHNLECDICSYTTRSTWSMQKHTMMHEAEAHSRHVCPFCMKPQAKKLQIHHLRGCRKSFDDSTKSKVKRTVINAFDKIVVKNNQGRAYHFCPSCNFRERSWVAVFEHFLMAHTNLHLHLCTHCQASFKMAESRDEHEKVCKGLKVPPYNQFLFKRWSGCYSCLFCSHRSTSKGVMLRHLSQKHPSTMRCSSCRKPFLKERNANFHLKLHAGMHHCGSCGDVFRHRSALWHHQMIFHSKSHTFKCSKPKCQFRALNSKDLVQHKVDCHIPYSDGSAALACGECLKHFKTYGKLRIHKMQCHRWSPSVSSFAEMAFTQNALPSPELAEPGSLICGVCSESFQDMKILKNHLINIHADWIDDHQEPSRGQAAPMQNDSLSDGTMLCQICSKAFEDEAAIRNHLQQVHPDVDAAVISPLQKPILQKTMRGLKRKPRVNPYTCPVCQEVLPHVDAITQHMHEHHPDVEIPEKLERPFVKRERKKRNAQLMCSLCGVNVTDTDAFVGHLALSHPEAGAEALTYAVRVAAKQAEREYFCSYCSYKHHIKSKVVEHEAVHTGDYPMRCDECGYGCFNNATMKRHQRCHTKPMDYICPECGKAYNTYSGYRQHIHSHSGQRIHECPVCNKQFQSSSAKIVHIFEHEGKLPFGCHLCEFECQYAGSFKKHLLRQHDFKAKAVFPRYDILSFNPRVRAPNFYPERADQNSSLPIEDVAEERTETKEVPVQSMGEPLMVLDMDGVVSQGEVMIDESALRVSQVIYIQESAPEQASG